MPKLNGQGPADGNGPGTGRGQGSCSTETKTQGGFRRGRGLFGRCCNMTQGRRFYSPKNELKTLQEEEIILQEELKVVQEEIKTLKAQK
ncbi:MAG: DUF5320 family protein [Candidatus Magasanikbacteria bacterium]|jgi:hypothetical protein|nr:DUF5320 family protein [Candidatus Magasanikbacteria bacterium]MBT4071300.1 DUF5320 family protein [Candidatus Magasanikbacteria bacterium]